MKLIGISPERVFYLGLVFFSVVFFSSSGDIGVLSFLVVFLASYGTTWVVWLIDSDCENTEQNHYAQILFLSLVGFSILLLHGPETSILSPIFPETRGWLYLLGIVGVVSIIFSIILSAIESRRVVPPPMEITREKSDTADKKEPITSYLDDSDDSENPDDSDDSENPDDSDDSENPDSLMEQ